MRTISIQVDDDLAQIYQTSSPEEQKKLQVLLNLWLRNVARASQRSLEEIMDEISNQAYTRGLTPEILDSLLNDE